MGMNQLPTCTNPTLVIVFVQGSSIYADEPWTARWAVTGPAGTEMLEYYAGTGETPHEATMDLLGNGGPAPDECAGVQ